jgi:peroxiredoxin
MPCAIRNLFVLLVLFGFFLGIPLEAKRVKLEIGDSSPTWHKLKGIDDKEHSLAELNTADVIVVVFTCNDCPIAQSYVAQLSKLKEDFEKKEVLFVAINSSKNEDLVAMKGYAKKKKITYSYLHDDSQKVAKSFGALRTPEVFLLDRDRKIAYMGAIDDAAPLTGKPKHHYLRDAIQAVLAGNEPPKTTTRAIGCAIRWK